ncbi:unnamed protein product [Coffea canephora]|uniref:Uncharacterized protein n=1 Tax=Coffea canephora TaxID=49390 RepID=A0A068VBB0_COFCA|nr:unnamed protein product [Coffea canephora]
MVYRVQNHALDLVVPAGENALLIRVDEKNSACCTHVPRQISKSDPITLLLDSWITDYESLHTQSNEPLEFSLSRISQTKEGRTSIAFDHSHLKSKNNTLSILFAEENCKKSCILQDIIQYFDTNRDAVYYFQDPISGHIYFDTCTNCEECLLAEQLECDVLDLYSKKNRSKRSKPIDLVPFEPRPCKPDPEPRQLDADDFTSCRSSFDGYEIPTSWKQTQEWKPVQTVQTQKFSIPTFEPMASAQPTECFMFQEADFPPLESFVKNDFKHTPKIQTPAPVILPTGETQRTNLADEVLNWQIENSLVQNIALTTIHHNVSEVHKKVNHIDTTVSSGFGTIPLRNWPTPFYFGNITTPNPSVFFPDQPQPASKPFDIAAIEAEQRKAEEDKKRKAKVIADQPVASLMYTANEATKVYDNPFSSMLEDLQQDSVPYITTYTKTSDPVSPESESSEDTLLDTRFTKYQHACIATVETTLNVGTIFVTLFPNFNMSLADPHLLDTLRGRSVNH